VRVLNPFNSEHSTESKSARKRDKKLNQKLPASKNSKKLKSNFSKEKISSMSEVSQRRQPSPIFKIEKRRRY
jgi:hypothetical protein